MQVRLKGHMNFCPPYKIEAVREYMLAWGGAYQWRVRNFKIWEIRGKFQRSLKAVIIKLCLGTILKIIRLSVHKMFTAVMEIVP